jgi:hypothetical protein
MASYSAKWDRVVPADRIVVEVFRSQAPMARKGPEAREKIA